jgi:hypothetical protein
MDVLKALEQKAFWGHEFLTWLWFRVESEGGELEVEGQGPVNLWIEERLVLESLDSESKENILKSGDVARSAEAAAALSVGKKVTQARFGLQRGDFQWNFLLDGATLDMRAMKIPTVLPEEEEGEDSREATLLVRMGHVRDCLNVVDSLFAQFAKLRASKEWEKDTVPAMVKWVAEKTGG